MSSTKALHIPAGCVRISKEQIDFGDETWALEELRTWNALALQEDLPPDVPAVAGSHERYLRPDVQKALLRAQALSAYAKLFRARWLKLEFSVIADDHALLRVYLLPDDVLRGTVDRSSLSLRKARQLVLSSLDYSTSAWNGERTTKRTTSPALCHTDQYEANEDMSLLELFNRIPSPRPNPEGVLDGYTKDAMCDLLESRIPGLCTQLYPYQRRSAALMLQREVQPGNMLDPRLMHVRDQRGSSWYMDPVAGTALLEPRHYDGVSGGILAEEMGSGKTLICLALILATKDLPTAPPSLYQGGPAPVRGQIASLADMAASCATRHTLPWKTYFDLYEGQLGIDFAKCRQALDRNPGYYLVPAPEPRRVGRHPSSYQEPPLKVYLSNTSLVIVPDNLVSQWRQEIHKHTNDLRVLTVVKGDHSSPSLENLLKNDIILFSQSLFEQVGETFGGSAWSDLLEVHFKRCIVDEGHKLGNSRINSRSNLLLALDRIRFSSRWIVTGTPSHGLFGVNGREPNGVTTGQKSTHPRVDGGKTIHETSAEMEKKDLGRIGAIAALYLRARPWANTSVETEIGDTLADWGVYMMLPKHNPKGRGRWDCLKSTLNTLIIRHQLAEVGDLLPPVEEKIIVLDGSYQDQLSLNIFSMMIIFNSVQSQRTDMDYFFHPRQKKSLLQIVHNLKQTSFFGGSFFTTEEIGKSVETAEQFLQEEKVAISSDDELLLKKAIEFGRIAMGNRVRNLSNQFHEMPVCVKNFPGGAGQSWSLGGGGEGEGEGGDTVCTSASLLLALQKLVYRSAGQPEEMNSLLNGRLIQEGMSRRQKILTAQTSEKQPASNDNRSQTLAGNTKLGKDSPRKSRSHGVNGAASETDLAAAAFSGPLKSTRMTSTVSAKLSYLIDGIVKYQDEEKIIVFYENENVAWYLASMLDVLQIQHLIYARGLGTARRAQYVETFHHNPRFRVLLMDLSQAAFGLDMRAASRIYFINPVLNPQVEAQAIGRVRRISQQKPVSVETLVLKGSIDEVLLERKRHMTQAEHRQVKSILDIRPIYNWIKNASILPTPGISDDSSQMSALQSPQHVFGRGFGKTLHPDDGLVVGEIPSKENDQPIEEESSAQTNGVKRTHMAGPGSEPNPVDQHAPSDQADLPSRPARRVRFAADSDEE